MSSFERRLRLDKLRWAGEVLVASKARIERYGWRQGDWGDRWSGMCAAGALDDSSFGTTHPGYMALYEATTRFGDAAGIDLHYRSNAVDGELGSIPDWNDLPGRTKQEVLEAFDKATESVIEEVERLQTL